MLIQFNFSEKFIDPFISINAKQKTEELNNLAFVIEKVVNEKILIGKHEDNYKSIYLHQIISIHTESKKIICETKDGNFSIKNRIYELSTLLPKQIFLQISSSEIVNITQIKEFSLSQTGVYQVNLLNGRKTYTSRRYAQAIRKEFLK
ncbi:MAG: LytTR family DNA-binding domain-containing protein [Liquorilactobacillus hordei]|uniref:LytTR family DNA-binding domain-containing protein n=1 Tax=Liquorilactobacillus hordei TaxID=468911 RepID=UPI001CBBAD75|nr:LytTR family DNA-binding domain-containing protein [Liquorilactobacillus hordei]